MGKTCPTYAEQLQYYSTRPTGLSMVEHVLYEPRGLMNSLGACIRARRFPAIEFSNQEVLISPIV